MGRREREAKRLKGADENTSVSFGVFFDMTANLLNPNKFAKQTPKNTFNDSHVLEYNTHAHTHTHTHTLAEPGERAAPGN